MAWIRQGTCNRCGQCCGAEGSPNQASPFPKNWPVALRHWSLDDINAICPQLTMLGLSQIAEDLVGVPAEKRTGLYRVGGKPCYYTWLNDGQGPPVKDTSPGHDGSSYSLECPFLKPDPGDGSRPCALVGSKDDGAYRKFCEPEAPERFDEQVQADRWAADHPACSCTWIEEPSE